MSFQNIGPMSGPNLNSIGNGLQEVLKKTPNSLLEKAVVVDFVVPSRVTPNTNHIHSVELKDDKILVVNDPERFGRLSTLMEGLKASV